MKKIIAFMAAAALPALMFAAPAQANDGSIDNSMSGFYVGGFGGHTWNNVDVSGAPSFDINGSDYGVFAGYKVESLLGTNAPINLSGAIEANYGWSHANETHLVGATPVEIRKDREWGVNFRPGLTFLSSAMPLGLHPYGIFGYRAADYKSSSAARPRTTASTSVSARSCSRTRTSACASTTTTFSTTKRTASARTRMTCASASPITSRKIPVSARKNGGPVRVPPFFIAGTIPRPAALADVRSPINKRR